MNIIDHIIIDKQIEDFLVGTKTEQSKRDILNNIRTK